MFVASTACLEDYGPDMCLWLQLPVLRTMVQRCVCGFNCFNCLSCGLWSRHVFVASTACLVDYGPDMCLWLQLPVLRTMVQTCVCGFNCLSCGRTNFCWHHTPVKTVSCLASSTNKISEQYTGKSSTFFFL